MKLFGNKPGKHRFLRRTVRLCLAMMTVVTLGELALAWHSGEQLSSTAITIIMGAWCTELLMTLIKRRGDDKAEAQAPEPTDTAMDAVNTNRDC